MLARFRGSKNLKTSVNYLCPTYSGQNIHNSFSNKKLGLFGGRRYSDRKDKDDDEKDYDEEDKKEKKISYDDYLYSNNTLPWKAAQFVDQTVRGVGQLTFVENTIGGVGIIGALSYFSPITALSVVVGSALSVFWANVIRADKGLIKSGLICFNGILVVAGAPFFIQPIVPVIAISIFGSLLATFMFDRACKHLSFPVLTLPFVITESLALLLTKLNIGVEPTFDFSLAPTPTLAHVTSDQLVPLLYKLAEAIPLSITQLCFTKDPTILFGAFFISLLVYLDKRVAASAVGGAIIGCTAGVLIGYDFNNILLMIGLNSVLTPMALYPTFERKFSTAMIASLATALAYPGFIYLFSSCGLLAFTAPFCIVTIATLKLKFMK